MGVSSMEKSSSAGGVGGGGAAGCPRPSMTYVQADTTNFREVVQRLTGENSAMRCDQTGVVTKAVGVKRPAFKLHERRHYGKTKLEIVKPLLIPPPMTDPNFGSSGVLLPSPLGTPSSIFSKLCLLEGGKRGEDYDLNTEEEEKAIRERRFYLHPSPRSNPGFTEPELLTLFPLSSPNAGDKS